MASVKTVPEEEITDEFKAAHVAGDDLSRSEEHVVDDHSHEFQLVVTYTPTDSLLIDRLIAQLPLSRRWVMVAISLVLLLLPVTFAYLDGLGVAQTFMFRAQFIYATIIVYLLVVCHLVQKTREGVAQAIRPIVQLDEKTFVDLVKRGCRVSPIGEVSAFVIGIAIGLIVNVLLEPIKPGPYFMIRYAYLSRLVLYGALGWGIYVIFSMTRLTNTLLRQPIDVDIFNLKPFEPIGRQSLWLSLSIVGVILLTASTGNFAAQELRLLYLSGIIIMIAVIATVFFLDTHNVHWILASTKRQQLDFVDRSLARAFYELRVRVLDNQETLTVATEMNALGLAKQELKAAKTWPYNTEMLRTLFISIMTPLAVGLSRLVAALLASGGF